MKLVIASQNQGKLREFRQILAPYFEEIVSMAEAGVDTAAAETGSSFRENALLKARYLYERLHCACLADDSGLSVDALGGAPGIYSARYAGEHGDDAANNRKLLKELAGKNDRRAAFVSCIALVLEDGTELIGEGRVQGTILHEAQGDGGFGYDPLFCAEELGKSFGLASPEEKNRISHRYRAAMELVNRLKECEAASWKR